MLNTSITGSRRFAADQWSLKRIKAAGAAHNATVNDVVLAMCAGALRRYLSELDALPGDALTAGVPVSLRSLGTFGDTGNAVGIVPCSLATHLEDPQQRLDRNRRLDELRESRSGYAEPAADAVTHRTDRHRIAAGDPGSRRGRRRPGPVNLIISNVPGPRAPLYWDGARMQGMYPLSVPQQGQALNITVVSYAGQLNFGLTGCRRRLPHMQHLFTYLEESLAELETVKA